MEKTEMLSLILDDLHEEIVFVDINHVIRYMNRAGKRHYAKFGDILGKSIFNCHKDISKERILNIFSRLSGGAEDVLYAENEKQRVYMRAVRDSEGKLAGYYERYEAKISVPVAEN